MLRVTDKQYWMHPTLKSNIDSLIVNSKDDFDFMIIVSGSGNVRTGKSVFAQQLAYYIEYCLSAFHDRELSFTVEENINFSGHGLIQNAKKKRNSVYVYDEAREGLNNKRMWDKKTQKLLNFFAECGMFNHFLIVVLPDFFELPKGIATTRSVAMINVFYKAKMAKISKGFGDIAKGQEYAKFDRGHFHFYNRKAKLKLWKKGKKEQDYEQGRPNFKGEFRDFWVVDRKEYEEKKLEHINRTKDDVGDGNTYLLQRNALFKMMNDNGMTQKEISKKAKEYGIDITRSAISRAIKAYNRDVRV